MLLFEYFSVIAESAILHHDQVKNKKKYLNVDKRRYDTNIREISTLETGKIIIV